MKYTLKFVNNGDPFEMPDWTVEKHEKSLAKLTIAQKENKWTDEQAAKEYKFYVIHETLLEIDPNCTLEDVKSIRHPATRIELFNAVYEAGKESIYYVPPSDFRKGQKTQKSKK